LWDSTGGTILINDRPIQDYKIQGLREAQATLRQDYQHFQSFTVAENIGIGLPERMDDMSRIRRAAEQGEAASVVAELEAKHLPGFDTDLKPLGTKTGSSVEAIPSLSKIYRSWEKDVELSGGQWQRLALARTFMRAPEASLICVDEPSAALDPRAEHGESEKARLINAGSVANLRKPHSIPFSLP
jgi:ABC-type multidrug transport system fused ATPase/permease subunit